MFSEKYGRVLRVERLTCGGCVSLACDYEEARSERAETKRRTRYSSKQHTW